MHKLLVLGVTTALLAGAGLPAFAQDAVIDLTPDQRTTIIQDFGTVDVAPVPDVDVTVGAVVPQTVTLQPLPETVIKVVPGYAKYKFFRASNGGTVIVEPDTMKVVTILK